MVNSCAGTRSSGINPDVVEEANARRRLAMAWSVTLPAYDVDEICDYLAACRRTLGRQSSVPDYLGPRGSGKGDGDAD